MYGHSYNIDYPTNGKTVMENFTLHAGIFYVRGKSITKSDKIISFQSNLSSHHFFHRLKSLDLPSEYKDKSIFDSNCPIFINHYSILDIKTCLSRKFLRLSGMHGIERDFKIIKDRILYSDNYDFAGNRVPILNLYLDNILFSKVKNLKCLDIENIIKNNLIEFK